MKNLGVISILATAIALSGCKLPASKSTSSIQLQASSMSKKTVSSNSVKASAVSNAPYGFLDNVSAGGVANGWTIDPTQSGNSITVQFYLDGPMGSGTLIGQASANLARPDVNAANGTTGNHGYSFQLPSSATSGIHPIYAYGMGENNASTLLSNAPLVPGGATVAIQASIDASPTGFEKYVYTFNLPVSQAYWVAFSGSVSITNKSANYTEMLISFFSYNGPCPTSGQHFDTYDELGAAEPGIAIFAHDIVKNPGLGTSEVPVNFVLPAGAPITGCVGAILDGGGISGKATPITMASNVVLTYLTTPEPTPPSLAGMGGEYCFGQSWGCNGAVTIAGNFNGTQNFATAGTVSAGTLVALYGDVADSSFDGNDQTDSPLPSGNWGATNDFYMLPGGCGPFVASGPFAANGTIGTGTTDLYSLLPSNAVHLLSLPVNGNGKASLQQSIYQPLSVPVKSGDCLVTIFGRQGNGASDNETQMMVMINPPGSQAQPVVTQPVVEAVVGNIDGITANPNGTDSVSGWACLQGSTQSISIAVYMGGPKGSGTWVGNFLANEGSEASVAAACQSSGSSYRFSSTISAALAQQFGGQPVYVYGVVPSGDVALNNSGTFSGTFKVATPITSVAQVCTPNSQQSCKTEMGAGSQSCNSAGSAWSNCGNFTSCSAGYSLQSGACVASPIVGIIDGVFGGNSPYIQGWACAENSTQSVNVALYLGTPGGPASSIGIGWFMANSPSEPAVAAACQSTGSAYRFIIPLSNSFLAQHGGDTISIYGISPFSGPNNLLSNSGNFTVPSPAAPAAQISISCPASAQAGSSVTCTATLTGTIVSGYWTVGGSPSNSACINQVTCTWNNVPAGNYSVAATGVDSNGATIQSNAVAVTVQTPALNKVYREYDSSTGWHMMTLTGTEDTPTYHSEGIGFHLYSAPIDTNIVLLYRCSYSNGYFVSTDSNCEGQTFNEPLGWAHTSAVGSEVPIYRFYAPWNGDHLITVNPSEGYSNGYSLEAILGYTQP